MRDVLPLELSVLEEKLGERGRWLYFAVRGFDPAPVRDKGFAKSIASSVNRRLPRWDLLKDTLSELAEQLARRVVAHAATFERIPRTLVAIASQSAPNRSHSKSGKMPEITSEQRDVALAIFRTGLQLIEQLVDGVDGRLKVY